jgi:hypothetical protein
MIAGSPVLSVRAGHDSFELTPEEDVAQASDDFELRTAEIPRPAF